MDELTYIERVYQLARDYRVEVVFTFMVFVNPVITMAIAGKWKNMTRHAGGKVTDAMMWRRGFMISTVINLPVATRWGGIHIIDAIMIGSLVGVLVPWTVRGLMHWSYNSKRFKWLYYLLLADRRRRNPETHAGEERRRARRVERRDDDPMPTLTTFHGDQGD